MCVCVCVWEELTGHGEHIIRDTSTEMHPSSPLCVVCSTQAGNILHASFMNIHHTSCRKPHIIRLTALHMQRLFLTHYLLRDAHTITEHTQITPTLANIQNTK